MAVNDFTSAVQGFMGGYDWASNIMKQRDTAEKEKQKEQQLRALAERMAEGPGGTSTMGDTAIPPSVTAPADQPLASGPEAFGAPPGFAENLNDPEVGQFEAELSQRTGKDIATKQDWGAFRSQLMQQAAAIGDPDTVMNIDKYVDGLQKRGFKQNASKAMIASRMGDKEAVEHHLKKAFSFMETGTTPRIQAIEDGNFVLMPVDEETGAPSGNPLVLSPKSIADLVAMTEDPAEFAKLQDEMELKERKAGTEEKRAEAEMKRLEEPAPGSTKGRLQAAQLRKAEADAKKAEAALKNKAGEEEWDVNDIQELNNAVTRYIQTRKEGGSDEMYDLYEAQGNDIARDAVDIAKAMPAKQFNLPNAINYAEKIAQLPGAQLAIDPSTNEVYVLLGDREIELSEL